MQRTLVKAAVTGLAAVLLVGCATSARQLMPTPALYQLPGGQPVFHQAKQTKQSLTPDLDLLFITDRAPEPESTLPYGQERARRIVFGSAPVRVGPGLDWEALREQSQLAKRTREVDLQLGEVREIGAFPEEPYQVSRGANGGVLRDRGELAHHFEAKGKLQGEVLLYVHGFNETFATAAYTAAELCHFLGREQVCAFFTWPPHPPEAS